MFSRLFTFILLLIVQVAFFLFLLLQFANLGLVAYIILTIVTLFILMALFMRDEINPAYKLIWVMVIAVLPVAGALFYVLWGHHHVPKRQRKQMEHIQADVDETMQQDPEVLEAIRKEGRMLYRSARYLADRASAPVYPAEETKYYAIGEDFYPDFLEALRGAEKSIYIQFYIFKEGKMLSEVLEIMEQKAAEGLDVRIIYDGFGSLFGLPPNFAEEMEKKKIQCRVFAPMKFTIHVSDYAMLNHRDHRKIAVIDGALAFTGGLNLADEYINEIERFGEWKDTMVLIRGEAALSLIHI